MKSKKNYKPIILQEAKEDMRSAALWYNKKKKGLGKDFSKRIRERVHSIQPNPFVCQVRYTEVHTAVVEQFPYMVHYTIDDTQKNIYVIAVLHTSQSPQIWDDTTK
ncbi:MAG: hypothetical protein A2275_09430 [Bacteroidetes bacterium RIFOXYA12_FULL_35_11]|nr:MAG: hypothetical protein A2X01_01055 [Bacteroidetes bacterium GWF2_35_48]OFY76114.1 MAG: hypothetical protein A2275_09430 [Bacteroidetes bacterium RIFOXYA12_FULL_35_11]OFY94285.1 MAG: hypothetical protein A2309_05790 [Bacteroidetes bacterium RIFOXYB2_FULL_35_7]OFZ05622.1 MAG: hypothetical protein A2491_17500 [Bacteroidetes bacterium RIFOXYC12_FULL_35_7]HBX51167.1 type II toxin-antitoxin system RelE/ParE family toxin [Bacteroidales bacterium]